MTDAQLKKAVSKAFPEEIRQEASKRPSDPPGPPASAVYAVGSVPIPQAVQAVVDEIKARAANKSNKAGFPQRADLSSMPSGVLNLDRSLDMS